MWFRLTPEPKPKATKASRRRAAERARRYRGRLRDKKLFEAQSPLEYEATAPVPQIAPNASETLLRDCVKGCGRKASQKDRQGYCDSCWLAAVSRILAEPLPPPEIPELAEPADVPHHMRTPVFDPDLDSRLMFGHNVAFAADSGEFSPAEGMAWNGSPSERAQLEQHEKHTSYIRAGGQTNGITK